MTRERLGKRDSRAALALLRGEWVSLGAMSPKFAEMLERDGIADVRRINARSRKMRIRDPGVFRRYLERRFLVGDPKAHLDSLENPSPTRADLARAEIGTKQRSILPKSGMHLNSPNGASVSIDGTEVPLAFPLRCALFVQRDSRVSVSPEAVIVGVENFENVTFASRQLSLFGALSSPVVFVERGPVMREWVCSLENRYIHYGDIDLAGIGIYLSEFAPRLRGEHSFFLPEGIEDRIRTNRNPSGKENYRKQLPQYRNIRSDDLRLQRVIDLIHRYKTGIEQEGFIGEEEVDNMGRPHFL